MPLPLDFLGTSANDRRRRTFTRHERRVAAALGGIRTIGSGNKSQKGDVWAGDCDAGQRLMVEAKSSEKDYVVLKLDWFDKLSKEAREVGREPVFTVACRVSGVDADFALIPLDRYRQLVDFDLDFSGLSGPDVHVSGRQTQLSATWFSARWNDRWASTIWFTQAEQADRRGWALLRLDRLKMLYEAEVARETVTHTSGTCK